MKSRLTAGFCALALVAGAWALVTIARKAYLGAAIAATETEVAALRAKADATREQTKAAEQRLATVDQDNARLVRAIESAEVRDVAHAARKLITPADVAARQRRADELARDGDAASALAEYLWCYDIGFARTRALLDRIARIGKSHPPARAALVQRRDDAHARVLASADDYEAMGDLIELNRALDENEHTSRLYDSLAPGDPRRNYLDRARFDRVARVASVASGTKGIATELPATSDSEGAAHTRAYMQRQAKTRAEQARARAALQEQVRFMDPASRFSRRVEAAAEYAERGEFQAAIRIFNEAITDKPPDMPLNDTAARLRVQLAAQKDPVNLIVVSDKATWVSVEGAKAPQKIGTATIKVPPGDYEVVGRRAGYKDVVIPIQVRNGVPLAPVSVVCTEPAQ